MVIKTAKVWIGGAAGVTAPIHLSQYDTDWRFMFSVYDGDAVFTGATAVYLEGRKADGTVFSVPGTFEDGVATVDCAAAITAAVGPIECELRLSDGDGVVGTANFTMLVEAAPLAGYVASNDDFSAMQQLLDEVVAAAGGAEEAKDDAEAAASAAANSAVSAEASAEAAAISAATAQVQAGMAYQIAATAADMTDHAIGYVYVGSEVGYTYGGWYYWDGAAWTLGGTAVDPTLLVSGAAADAKIAGDYVHKQSPFEPVRFGRSGYTSNNTAIFDGSYSATQSYRAPSKVMQMPAFGESGPYAIMCQADDPWWVTLAGGETHRVGAYIKLKTEDQTTQLTLHYSNANTWGGNYIVSLNVGVNISRSGYYTFSGTVNAGAYATDFVAKWFGAEQGGLLNVDYIVFYPVDLIVENLLPFPDYTLAVSRLAADAKITGDYVHKLSPFEPVRFVRSGIANDNTAVYDGSAIAVKSYRNPFKMMEMPAFGDSGLRGIMCQVDDPWMLTVDPAKTYSGGIYIKLKNEEATSLTVHYSNAFSWGGVSIVAMNKGISVDRSGYYSYSLTPLAGASVIDYKIQFFGCEGAGLLNVDYVVFYPLNAAITNIANPVKPVIPGILFWGDSLTAGAGGGGTTYPGVCAGLLNKTYRNCGVGGENANTIAARQGGNNIIIPAGAINGTYPSSSGFDDVFGGIVKPLVQGNGDGSGSSVYINGELCTLSNNGTNYTISGYTGGSSAIPLEGRFVGDNFDGDINVFWVGQNGATAGSSTNFNARISIINSMISKLKNKKFVVLGLSTGTDTNRADDDQAMLIAFGNKFLNIRRLLVDYGLTVAGLTPTAQDETDIANGTVPTSLRSDGTHMNAYGYTAIGTFVAEKIKALGYLEAGSEA